MTKWIRARLRHYIAARYGRKGQTWIGNYFIRKTDADILHAGGKIPANGLTLYGYGDLGSDPGGRLRSGDPDALVACDLLVGRWW